MAKEPNGKLKKLAIALKPIRFIALSILILWVASGLVAVFAMGLWGLITAFLAFLTSIILMIVSYYGAGET